MATINVTAGAQEYVGGLFYEKTGKDISGDTFVVGLSLIVGNVSNPPVTWVTPTVNSVGTASFIAPDNTPIPATAQRTLLLMVTNTTLPGFYSFWCKVTDSPEILPRLIQDKITIQ